MLFHREKQPVYFSRFFFFFKLGVQQESFIFFLSDNLIWERSKADVYKYLPTQGYAAF